jgi:hypothetical protein
MINIIPPSEAPRVIPMLLAAVKRDIIVPLKPGTWSSVRLFADVKANPNAKLTIRANINDTQIFGTINDETMLAPPRIIASVHSRRLPTLLM